MANVVFVAPFFMESTLRFVDAAAKLPDVRLAVLSQDPEEGLPPGLRSRIAGHYRIADGMDAGQIKTGVEAMARAFDGGGGVDRVVGTLEQLQVPLAMVRESLGVPGMSVEAAVNFRDKSRMKTVLAHHGVPCARHRLAHSPDDVIAFAREVGFPLVVKPPAGAGAVNTFQINDGDELRRWLQVAPPHEHSPAQVEEFLVGEELSFDSVCIDGQVVWHSVSRYLPTPLEVLRNSWIQWVVLLPRDIDGPEYAGIAEAGPAALRALGMRTGLSHMEWFRLPDGAVAVSEVAARPPGAQITTLLSWAHDRDFYDAWARLMVFDRFDPPERRHAAGAAFLRGQGHGRVQAIRGLDQIQQEVGDLVVEARLPKEGQDPSSSYEGDGYVIVRHPDTAAVEHALRRIVETIRVELG